MPLNGQNYICSMAKLHFKSYYMTDKTQKHKNSYMSLEESYFLIDFTYFTVGLLGLDLASFYTVPQVD